MQSVKAGGIVALLVLNVCVFAKRNDDVVIMKNGDRFTGEIKRLEEGKLIFSASYMASDVTLDWTKVDRLESKDEFNVYLMNGGAHTGHIAKTSEDENSVPSFTITQSDANVQVRRDEVVVVRPIEDSVWKQPRGPLITAITLPAVTMRRHNRRCRLRRRIASRDGGWNSAVVPSLMRNRRDRPPDATT